MFIYYPEKLLINSPYDVIPISSWLHHLGPKVICGWVKTLLKIIIIINFGETNIHVPAILRLGLPGFWPIGIWVAWDDRPPKTNMAGTKLIDVKLAMDCSKLERSATDPGVN